GGEEQPGRPGARGSDVPLERESIDEDPAHDGAVARRAEHERSSPHMLHRGARPRRGQDEDERLQRLRGSTQIAGNLRRGAARGVPEMREHLLGRLAGFGQEDLAGRLEPAYPIPDTLVRPGSNALDLAELAPLARFLELRHRLDTQAAPQDLDALQAQLRYAAQLGGTGGKAAAKVFERPRRSRPVELCDDRCQTRADPAKLCQAPIID